MLLHAIVVAAHAAAAKPLVLLRGHQLAEDERRTVQHIHGAHHESDVNAGSVVRHSVLASASEMAPVEPWAAQQEPTVGLACDEHQPDACGALMCRQGVCAHCVIDKDCPDKFGCYPHPVSAANMCVPRSLRNHWQASDTVCTCLIVLTAMLSAAAGLGGGGVYVPLTVLFVGLKTTEAVPLSQAMVFAGAVVNVALFINEGHPDDPMKPRIAYDVVMMLNPGLAAGVVLGVMAHVVSPSWLTLACLFATLILAFQKTFGKATTLFAKEQKLREEAAASSQNGQNGGGGDHLMIHAAKTDTTSFFSPMVRLQIMLILLCWGGFLGINMMHPERCTGMHAVQLACFLVCAVAFSYGGARVLKDAGPDADAMKGWKYPMMAVVAGFLGGFLGIGGGLIMGPVLLEMGLKPEVSQATTAMFVLLSSSLGTVQFMLLGKEMPYFALWYSLWVAGATVIGQVASDYVVRVYKRSSLIVFAVAGIIAASAAMMVWAGALDVHSDWTHGKPMGVQLGAVCVGH